MAKIVEVTQEYENTANPKSGCLIYGQGYQRTTHKHEIAIAVWLNTVFGGEVLLLKENAQHYGLKTPDYLWRDATWELKSVSSNKYDTIDKRIRKACEQIRENAVWKKRGGVILDFTGNRLSMEKIRSYVITSSEVRAHGVIDIIIKKGNEYIVLRTQKE